MAFAFVVIWYNDIHMYKITDSTCLCISFVSFSEFFEYTTSIQLLTNYALSTLKHIFPLFKQYFISTLTNNYKISQTVCLLCIQQSSHRKVMCITHGRLKTIEMTSNNVIIQVHIYFIFRIDIMYNTIKLFVR